VQSNSTIQFASNQSSSNWFLGNWTLDPRLKWALSIFTFISLSYPNLAKLPFGWLPLQPPTHKREKKKEKRQKQAMIWCQLEVIPCTKCWRVQILLLPHFDSISKSTGIHSMSRKMSTREFTTFAEFGMQLESIPCQKCWVVIFTTTFAQFEVNSNASFPTSRTEFDLQKFSNDLVESLLL